MGKTSEALTTRTTGRTVGPTTWVPPHGIYDCAGDLETRPTRLAMGNSRIDEVYDLCGWLDCPRTDED